MDLSELARWTPVRLDFSRPTPAVFWADLTAVRFDEPFFDRTVARWASNPTARPLVKTGLDALVTLDSAAVTWPTAWRIAGSVANVAPGARAWISTASVVGAVTPRCCRVCSACRPGRGRPAAGWGNRGAAR